MMTGPPTQAALLVSACIALCKSQPEKSEATRDDEADPARPHRYRPVPNHDWPVHKRVDRVGADVSEPGRTGDRDLDRDRDVTFHLLGRLPWPLRDDLDDRGRGIGICLDVERSVISEVSRGRGHTLYTILSTSRFLARRADLLPNYLSQRLIDPVLPARSGFLKVIKNVSVNSQRDKLLGIRDSRTLRREFRGLRGRRLERRFSRIP